MTSASVYASSKFLPLHPLMIDRGIAWNKPHSIPKLYLVIVFITAIKPKNKTSSQRIIKKQTFQEKAVTCTVKHKIYNVSLKRQNNKICKMKSTNILLTNHGWPLKKPCISFSDFYMLTKLLKWF